MKQECSINASKPLVLYKTIKIKEVARCRQYRQ